MKWIKKVATTPITAMAMVIDSLSGSSATNAPSINAVKNAINNLLTEINGKQDTITGSASSITSSNLTANRALITNGSKKVAISDTTATELGYVHGVTSAIQNQIDGKEDTISLTANRTVVSDGNGKLSTSTTTKTELGYVHGVTSAIQTQLNGKQSSISILQKDLTASAPNAGDVYSVTAQFTANSDGYDGSKDLGMVTAFSDTNSIRIVSITRDINFSNASIKYYVLFTGTSNGAVGTITVRILQG